METPRNEWVEIGVVARAHGVRGWLRVRLHDPSSRALSDLKEISLGAPERVMRIRTAEADASGYRIQLEGIDDRDAADALRGLPIVVARDRLPPLGDEELYVADLVGCSLVDRQGAVLGTVSGVFHSGAHEVLVLKRAGGDEAMVPLVDEIVIEVDLEGKRIVCDPPEGLLEVNARAGGHGPGETGA